MQGGGVLGAELGGVGGDEGGGEGGILGEVGLVDEGVVEIADLAVVVEVAVEPGGGEVEEEGGVELGVVGDGDLAVEGGVAEVGVFDEEVGGLERGGRVEGAVLGGREQADAEVGIAGGGEDLVLRQGRRRRWPERCW